MYPQIAVTGLGDYNRNSGYTQGTVDFKWVSTKYNYDRGAKLSVDKPAVIKHDKHVVSNVIPASANPDADADIVKYRKYGLVDVYKNKLAGIYLSHKA